MTENLRQLIQSGSGLHGLQAVFRRSVIQEAIRLCRTRGQAARLLKIHRNTLERIDHRKGKLG